MNGIGHSQMLILKGRVVSVCHVCLRVFIPPPPRYSLDFSVALYLVKVLVLVWHGCMHETTGGGLYGTGKTPSVVPGI